MRALIGIAGLVAMSATGFAANNAALTPAQKQAVQSVVHDYLVNQPEVLIEASQALQKKQQARMQEDVKKAVAMHAKALFQSPLSTVGNMTGAVTLVEFFDYQCGHCKQMVSVMETVMKNAPNLRIIYKDFPIFGNSSVTAAKAALAAGMQHRYLAMHDALLRAPGHLTDKQVFAIAEQLKLDMAKLKTDMDSPTVEQELKANHALAEVMQLMGTPAFLVASTPNGIYQESKPVVFIPGAASEVTLLELIKKA